jgi:hypothetical protein
MMAILTGVRWNLSVILVCISFIAKGVEYFFMYLLSIVLLLLRVVCSIHLPITSLSCWLFGGLVFLAPCMFWLLIPCQMNSWQRCYPIFFAIQKLFSLMQSYLFILSLNWWTIEVLFRKLLPMSKCFHFLCIPAYNSYSCKSYIKIFCSLWTDASTRWETGSQVDPVFSAPFVDEAVFFSTAWFGLLCQVSNGCSCVDFCLVFMSVFLSVLCCFYCYDSVVQFKFRCCHHTFSIALFAQNCFGYSRTDFVLLCELSY